MCNVVFCVYQQFTLLYLCNSFEIVMKLHRFIIAVYLFISCFLQHPCMQFFTNICQFAGHLLRILSAMVFTRRLFLPEQRDLCCCVMHISILNANLFPSMFITGCALVEEYINISSICEENRPMLVLVV